MTRFRATLDLSCDVLCLLRCSQCVAIQTQPGIARRAVASGDSRSARVGQAAFRENSYLSPVVRVQKERGQTVISTGPYHYVRHPMYSAMVIFFVGTSLMLGSWYGVLFGLIIVLLLARRAVLEERTLQRDLSGYTAYMAGVKYRLMPHVW